MGDITVAVNFDGNPGLAFTQGEDRTIIATICAQGTNTPVNLTGGVVGINFPLQGGGSIKRTNGLIAVAASAVTVLGNLITLTDHGFVTGDQVQVAAQGGGSLPSPLSPSTNYLIVVVDVNTFYFTDTSNNVITLTSQGTVGFTIQNLLDLTLSTPTLGQVTLALRAAVSAQINAALAQTLQVEYTLSGKTRIALISNQLDVYSQPVP